MATPFIGHALAVAANVLSSLLLYPLGGCQALLDDTSMTRESLDESLIFGPDDRYTSWWWLTIATPHTNTPLAIAASLGMGLLVTGLFLLIAARTGRLLTPLAAMGSMTLTLYSAHLVALALEMHYDQPHLWFMIHVGAAAAFAWFWHRSIGRGPLEVVVTRAVKGSHSVLRDDAPGTTGGPPAPTPDGP